MLKELNKNYLITTNDWFIAPDGNSYKSVFGTVTGIHSDAETLGIQTNRHSTNWYLTVGKMVIAGCQVFYCIRTDEVSMIPPKRDVQHENSMRGIQESVSRIYNANA